MIIAKHYKGGTYQVMGTGRAEASREPKVYYRPLTNHTDQDWYDRPLEEFVGYTVHEGKPIKRYLLTDSETGKEAFLPVYIPPSKGGL